MAQHWLQLLEGIAKNPDATIDVLPLLSEHGGLLERRLRNSDGTIEVHIVSFESDQNFQDYRNDPRRTALSHLFEASAASTERLAMTDVA